MTSSCFFVRSRKSFTSSYQFVSRNSPFHSPVSLPACKKVRGRPTSASISPTSPADVLTQPHTRAAYSSTPDFPPSPCSAGNDAVVGDCACACAALAVRSAETCPLVLRSEPVARSRTSAALTPDFFDMRSSVSSRVSWVVSCGAAVVSCL